jgi:hypothetical protein
MRPIASTARPRALGLALALLCSLAVTAPAHAQYGQQIGNTVGIPLQQFGAVVAANAVRQRSINFIALSQLAYGNWNNQIAIVGVTQRNGFNFSPAQTMYLPNYLVPWMKQVNLNRIEVNQVSAGSYNTQVAEVDVAQSNYASAPEGAFHYMFCPSGAVGPLFQLNANLVIITQVAVGDGNTQVALVGVQQSNGGSNVKVPGSYANSLVQINTNVNVITQVATGSGNSQVATVNVGQQNG